MFQGLFIAKEVNILYILEWNYVNIRKRVLKAGKLWKRGKKKR